VTGTWARLSWLKIVPGQNGRSVSKSTLIPANEVQLSLNGKAAAAQPFTHTRHTESVNGFGETYDVN
jgi:hypothetical protein